MLDNYKVGDICGFLMIRDKWESEFIKQGKEFKYLCPCQNCIVKVKCFESCKLFDEIFSTIYDEIRNNS